MTLFDELETVSNEADTDNLWKGSFREFLKKYEAEKDDNANIGVLAHQRLYNMILASGTEKKEHFGKERTYYNFFEETLFGIEDSLDDIMTYIHSAAQRTETSRRMLLMYGPPSSGKCLAGDTEVYDCTTGQMVRINDIVENGRRVTVCAFNKDNKTSIQSIKARQCNGVRKTYSIKTSLGREIKATANHKFLTYDGWKTVGELTLTDRIAIPRILPEPMKILAKPLEEVRFCAYMIGEGNCVNRISFTNTEDIIRSEFTSDSFVLSHSISPDLSMSARKDGIALRIVKTKRTGGQTPNPLKQWLVTNKLWGKLATEKECPSFVFQLPNIQLGVFLGRLYTCDGHISGNTINYCTASRKLAQNMVTLLSRLGIMSKLRYKEAKYRNQVGDIKSFDSWQLDVTDSYSVENFKEHIAPHLIGRRLSQFNSFWQAFSNKVHRGNIDVFPAKVRRMIKSEMKSKGMKLHSRNYREPGLHMLRTDNSTRNISRRKLAVAEKVDSEDLRKLVDSDICYDRIIAINVDEHVKVYDIEVPRFHNFVANNIVTHNSDIVQHLKRGLEDYTQTPAGAIYALSGSKMHENPFLLIPEKLRVDFEKQYGLRIEGQLSPTATYELRETYKGKFMDYPVEQILLTEAGRKGIGTWLPQDPKGQDQSELVGGIDFAKIQEFGDEADPRCYNFNGELNVANRGIMEFIEGLKSVVYGTYIPTSSGIKKIGDIHGPEKNVLIAHERVMDVNSGEGVGQIIRSCFKGKALCRKVKTKKGYSFIGSIDHRVKTLNEAGVMEWKPVCELLKGDIIPISTQGIWVDISPKNNVFVRKTSRSRLKLPKRMTRKLARFLGYYVSEGSYNRWTVCISNVHQYVIDDVFSIAKSLGLNSRYDKKGHSVINSVELTDFLKGCGLCGNDSDFKVIPQIILDSPKQYVVEFLRAYFDGDGTVNDHRISCTSSSVELINQLHILLLNFGIISQTSKFWNEKYEKFYYSLSMDSIYRDLFMKEIGFNIDYKTRKAERTVRKRNNHRHVIDCHCLFRGLLKELKSKCSETLVSVSSKHYSRDVSTNALVSRRVYNHLWAWSNKKRCPSVAEIRKILPELPDDLEYKDVLSNLVRGDLYFDTVDEIGPEHLEEIYDVHENSKHSYVGNGLIHHNSDERFLRVLLTATQEKAIKAPRFGLIYCDTVILLHTNEEEFRNFMGEKKYEAYHDRMVIVKVPYNLSMSNEVKIYEKLLSKSDAIKNMHIAPKTLQAAAMFAILTRLAPPPDGGELTLIKKMKLYDKQHVRGHKIEQVPDMKRKEPKEGMTGVSPRFTIDQISASIAHARDEGRDYITPLDVLRQLNKGVFGRDSFDQNKKNHFESLIDEARSEWDDLLRNDIQKAFFVSYEKEARNLCENYLDQIDAACAGTKPRDPITGDEIDLDEKLMDSVEQQIDITSSGKEDFRNEILRALASAAKHDRKFDYTQHSQLREAIQKKLFEERKNVIRMTVSTRNPDTDELKKINDVIARMVDQQGYSEAAANALLKYATAHLFDK